MFYDYTDWVDVAVEIDGDADVRLSASFAQFQRPVRLADCTIHRLDLHSAYFLRGLEIKNCRILCDVNWPWGGHNRLPIRIVDTEIIGFLDLEDCLFEAEVIFQDVKLHKGTNLLGNVGTPVEVSFEMPPVLELVEGQLDVNTYKPSSPDNDQPPSHPVGQ